MPTSKNKRKNGRNKVTARSRKTKLRELHKKHAVQRRERAYARVREIEEKFNEEDAKAFEEALSELE